MSLGLVKRAWWRRARRSANAASPTAISNGENAISHPSYDFAAAWRRGLLEEPLGRDQRRLVQPPGELGRDHGHGLLPRLHFRVDVEVHGQGWIELGEVRANVGT